MAVKEDILRLFAERPGETLSGQWLAAECGVSRNAIWKAVDKLRGEGYAIDAQTNAGYTLLSAPVRVSLDALQTALGADAPFTFEHHRLIDSTNSHARTLADAGAPEWTVVFADAQSAGRGRLGRSFYSLAASGLYMSVIVRPRCAATEAHLLTIAAAAAVAEGIEAVCGVTTQIKWVNDCFMDGRKVAGILTEASIGLEEQALRYAVVGIGINVAAPAGGMPQALADIATAIYQTPPDAGVATRLAAEILKHFYAYAQELQQRTYLPSYRQHLMVLGRTVRLERGKERMVVRVLDLTENGALIVETEEGKRLEVASGEVSLRL